VFLSAEISQSAFNCLAIVLEHCGPFKLERAPR
jgi:hypothetical protein